MEVSVELPQSKLAENCYVAVRVGDTQKVQHYRADAVKPLNFPAAKRFCKVTLLKQIGSCDLCIDPEEAQKLECQVASPDPELAGMKLKWSSTPNTMPGGKVVKKDEEGSAALQKYLQTHNVEAMLACAVRELLRQQPLDARQFLIDYIKTGAAPPPVKAELEPTNRVGDNQVLVINGFYMSMRDCYTRPGAKIHYYVIEWDPAKLSWADFRGKVLGATDPSAAAPGSLRGTIKENWKSLGLHAAPTIRDNGVHASASPFEGLAERSNWLGESLADDPFAQALLAAGVPQATQAEWTDDPQVEFHKQKSSLFDLLEDLDVEQCLGKAARIVGAEGSDLEAAKAKCAKNMAFVFIKPHAASSGGSVQALVREKFAEAGISITKEGELDNKTIDDKKLIDKHYGAIASKAAILTPDKTNPSAKAKDMFGTKFGLPWESALEKKLVLNAVDACQKLNINGDEMEQAWNKAKDAGELIKFGGGFYCALVEAPEPKAQEIAPCLFTINGFYMSMRDCYTRPGAKMRYFMIEWEPSAMSWHDFRNDFLGATDPKASAPASLRGTIASKWRELGLQAAPTVRDNGVHASASPFEAMAERANWLGKNIADDDFGKALGAANIPVNTQTEWLSDPQVEWHGQKQSLFDLLEDLDVADCIGKAARLVKADAPSDAAKALCSKNTAFLFVKPHAMVTDGAVETFVKQRLQEKGVTIVGEGVLEAKEIDEKKLIDKHYGAIASKASLLKPKALNPSTKAKEQFQGKFGLSWETALEKGMVLNAVDACAHLGIDGDKMEKVWNQSKDAGSLVKFGGGFYCAKIDAAPQEAVPKDLYCINGFYMAMRDNYTRVGAKIHLFDVEWDREKLAWADFRQKVLGATDPEASAPGSLRGTIKEQWKSLGLPGPCSVQNNGVHASASPFEAMAERANWLGADIANDPFGKALASIGVPLLTQNEWCSDSQVNFEGKNQSIFDLLEDLDSWPLLGRAARVIGADKPSDDLKASCPKNRAVVFVKPHAMVETRAVEGLVREKFKAEGISILSEKTVSYLEIDQNKMIDKHYGAIAAKASLMTPDQTNPSEKAKEQFGMTFGLSWEDALKKGLVYNAIDACKKLSIEASDMTGLWDASKKRGELIKFGGGFYCGRVKSEKAEQEAAAAKTAARKSVGEVKPAAEEKDELLVINGFYMSMRDCYTRPGARINYFEVEWDPAALSWADFRSQILGATDPKASASTSLRGTIREKWKELGLKAEPTIRDNGVHASASPFEAMCERVNWLEADLAADPFGKAMTAAGIVSATQTEWLTDPQVEFHKQKSSLYDLLEDLDVADCLGKAARIVGAGELSDDAKALCKTNKAFVFVKPHAMVGDGAVEKLVRQKFADAKISILNEGVLDAKVIDEKKLIDKHYGAIASKASLLKPAETNPSSKAKEQFGEKFSLPWDVALQKNMVFNAVDACKKLGINGDEMEKLWSVAKDNGKLLKFGGGFYCGRIELVKTKPVMYCINGFYMSMRDCYTRPGARIHYFCVEWDKEAQGLTWSDFRATVLGATDPKQAMPGSLRATINDQWRQLGLQAEPSVRDNGVHASASPLEALAERANWLEEDVASDPVSKALADAGVPLEMQKEWMSDPQIRFEGKSASLFDTLEDMDTWALMGRAARIVGVEPPSGDKKASCPKNMAFVFVKPHAMVGGGSVEKLVKETLEGKGMKIVKEGVLEAAVIEQKKLIDKHYGAIASKASLLTPDALAPSSKAKGDFGSKFGLPWETALEKGLVFNAVDACKKIGVDGDKMEKIWNQAKADGNLIKFGGGFYCAKLDATPPEEKKAMFTINGFYMGMRDCYTKSGAKIHWFDVEWDREKVTWADFRQRVLGATDPEASAPGSLRNMIKEQATSLGLPGPCSVRDNGVHASASPFEAMCERANWLEKDLADDPFAQALLAAGIPIKTQKTWVSDPQVPFEGKNQSLFDILEDMDSWPLLGRAARVAGLDAPSDDVKGKCPKNRALVFIKPHAMLESRAVEGMVREKFSAEGISIMGEGTINNSAIDEKKLIDKHYGAIAAKASLMKPNELNPTEKAKESFGMTFGLSWEEAVSKGQVFNAVDACKELKIDGDQMGDLWDGAKKAGKLIKFGGGFYCAEIA
eukprot:TRINITY_DN1987_c0_g2_i1.p1 TRINITY_DN1987_c0_g2~~TRINITY_DN1987_c0_g2_i1.p1  ORF type:complete len:2122 (-),score=771.88 TRINITY_DN1987_c0_g2_i1:341-6706(-)